MPLPRKLYRAYIRTIQFPALPPPRPEATPKGGSGAFDRAERNPEGHDAAFEATTELLRSLLALIEKLRVMQEKFSYVHYGAAHAAEYLKQLGCPAHLSRPLVDVARALAIQPSLAAELLERRM